MNSVANRSRCCSVEGTTVLCCGSSIFGPSASLVSVKICGRINVWGWPLNDVGFPILTSDCRLSKTDNVTASIKDPFNRLVHELWLMVACVC